MTNEAKELAKEVVDFAEISPFPQPNIMYEVVYEQEDYPFINQIENS